jgi:hypothetical protein
MNKASREQSPPQEEVDSLLHAACMQCIEDGNAPTAVLQAFAHYVLTKDAGGQPTVDMHIDYFLMHGNDKEHRWRWTLSALSSHARGASPSTVMVQAKRAMKNV